MAAVRERALAPVLICVGLIVSLISSLGAPLIPTIARDLHVPVSGAQWSLTAPLVVAAVASPIVGRLGDGRHRRTVMLVCLLAVAIGALLAALAHSLAVLVTGRAMQGLGLAVMPLSMAAAREHLPPGRSPHVIAMLSVIAAVGVGLGYPLTGLIAAESGISAAFWFGAIVSCCALLLAALVVPAGAVRRAATAPDVIGAALITVALVAVLLALDQGDAWGWGSRDTLGLFALAVIAFAATARYELRVENPLLDLRQMTRRAVLTGNVAGFALGVLMYMSLVLLTQFVQTPPSAGFGFGASTFVAGLMLVPLSACSFLASRCVPPVQRRLGARAVVPIGSCALAAACLFFGVTGTSLWQAFVTTGLAGLGLGFTFAAIPGLIVGAIPAHETSRALSVYQVCRFIGFAVGSCASVTLLQVFGNGDVSTFRGFRTTFLIAAALGAATALLSWLLPGAGRIGGFGEHQPDLGLQLEGKMAGTPHAG